MARGRWSPQLGSARNGSSRQGHSLPLGRSWLGNDAGQSLGDLEPPLALRQHQDARIRGQLPAIEDNVNRLEGRRPKKASIIRLCEHPGGAKATLPKLR
jgi:hypothetical protein